MNKSIGVIGGGLGGLTAALRLAKNGFKVSLFEKNQSLGGKMNQVIHGGYRFDTGPSLLTMPFVIDELYYYLGLDRKQYLDFEPIDPICQYFWDDGTKLSAYTEMEKMREAMTNISIEDAKNLKDFLLYSRRIWELTADTFLYTAVHETGKILNKKTLKKLLKIKEIDPFRTVHQGIGQYFKHPKIVQIFDRYATYNGSDPFKAPATLNIIPYVEYVLGSFYIKGGMYQLIENMKKLCQKLNVNIHTENHVDKILHKSGRVYGLQIDGEKIDFDYVVCNNDVVTSYNDLIEGYNHSRRKLNRLEPSLSGAIYLWGIKGQYQNLAHHNIFFSNDYKEEFQKLFNSKKTPDDPTIYVAITSKSDSNHAPVNSENWFVLCNMPYLHKNWNWQESGVFLRKAVLNKLKKSGFDIESQIEYENILSPEDIYQLYNSNKGSIYGLSSNSRLSAFRRPANRNRDIKGLYFAGGSTHPGGGIPLVMLSGKLTADLILENEGLGNKF
ncbi:MAG: phytoene desaturase [Calditrichaceae bacterium]|nr:phytoene desaturase [Calditrichaceae bacterium]